MFDTYEDFIKVCTMIVLMLGSCYLSLLCITQWLCMGALAWLGVWPSALFGVACVKVLQDRINNSPAKLGSSEFDDRIFPDDAELEAIVQEFLSKKKPLPTPRT